MNQQTFSERDHDGSPLRDLLAARAAARRNQAAATDPAARATAAALADEIEGQLKQRADDHLRRFRARTETRARRGAGVGR